MREIQRSLLSGSGDLAPVLLKLRYLASQLGSIVLEEWVKHEAEGYPPGVDVPQYRKVSVEYIGDFSGPFGSGIRNAPIPSFLIEQFAGEKWVNYEIRQSLSSIDALVGPAREKGRNLQINASNLILMLQGKVYEKYACNNVSGRLSTAALVDIQNAVRNRILELTISIEKEIPYSKSVDIGSSSGAADGGDGYKVSNITNQIVYGNLMSITGNGNDVNVDLDIAYGVIPDVVRELSSRGIPESDSNDFAKALADDGKSPNREDPFGPKAKNWIKNNIGKALDGTWKIGVDVASKLLTEVALRYYGFK